VTAQTPEEFADGLRRVAGQGGFRKALIAELKAGALVGNAAARQNATDRPHARMGHLRASIAGLVREEPGSLDLAIGSGSDPARPGVPYAAMQEFGGVQLPRTAKMLRIPLEAAKTAAGVDRFPRPLRVSAPDKFFLYRSKAGNLLLRDRLTGIPWYVLKHSVTIPGTHFLMRAVETTSGYLEGTLSALLERVLDEAEKEASGG